MSKKNLLLIPVIAITLTLAGCASDSKRVVDLNLKYMTSSSAPVGTVDKNAQAQLSEAASSVGQSLQQLSAVEMATHPGVKMPSPPNAKAMGMSQEANLNWSGPVEPLVKKVASAANYRVRILGNRPAVPVIVNINTPQATTLADILRNATYQVAGKANISVYPSKRLIELRYVQ